KLGGTSSGRESSSLMVVISVICVLLLVVDYLSETGGMACARSYRLLVSGRYRSSKSHLAPRLISAHAGGNLSDFILGQRWLTPLSINDEQRGLDRFGIHPAPAHCSGQAC